MAKAVQKIKLSPSRDIPFNKLVLSQSNVRRVRAGISIEDLAEDVGRRGLLQSLNVRPILDADGQETDMWEVPAGGRRYRALELLVKQKRLAKNAPIPCVIKEAGGEISAEEDSLAENVHRVALHPLDQFRAFQTLREQRKSEEEIAAIFFVSVNVVKQRLRLAAVSPKLLDVYADDGMSLEQLMAFSVTADHARQEQVWENVNRSGYDEPYQIRRVLTERAVKASDKRARFVGLAAYEAAGGNVLHDLFEEDGGGWLQDIALLDRLIAEKLRTEAETIAPEGWKWIEIAPSFPYGYDHGLRRLESEPADLTVEEQASLDALQAEYTALQEKYEDADEIPDEADTRLGELEQALAAFEDWPHIFDAAAVPHAGAFVSIDTDGTVQVARGYVRGEDEAAFPAAVVEPDPESGPATPGSDDGDQPAAAIQGSVITMAGQVPPDEEEEDAIRPLPDRLVIELTAHRTLALQDAVAAQPQVAMTVLLHKLCVDAFHRAYGSGCLEAGVRHVQLSVQAPELKESASAKSIAARHDVWNADVPADEAALWDWLVALDDASRLALLAHCVSFGVNALFEKADRHGGPGITSHGLQRRLDQADRLARAVGLDMVEAGWRPTVDNYLGRVTKGRILDAVREARGESSVQLIDHLKKSEMAKEAERLLEGAGWLPEPLRIAAVASPSDSSDAPSEPLPEFSPAVTRNRPTAARASSRTPSRPNRPSLRGGIRRPAVLYHFPFISRPGPRAGLHRLGSTIMTDDTSTPGSGFDSASWLLRDQEFIRLCKSTLSENKTALFDALASARIDTVEVTFNGYADEGQIEGAVADGEGGDTDLQSIHVEIVRVECGNQIVTRQTLSVKDAIEKLVYDLLKQTYSGWENNQGAYGDFLFDVAERTITLNFNERIETSEYTQHVF